MCISQDACQQWSNYTGLFTGKEKTDVGSQEPRSGLEGEVGPRFLLPFSHVVN